MSSYEFIHFLAIDRPLDGEQLEFMRRQSTRADVSRWEFTNEYHFSGFRGNTLEMLRRGYDVHLHFADYGVRQLMFRLPGGLPCDRKLFDQFVPEHGLAWHVDRSGPGGILEINPEGDGGTWEGYVPDLADVLNEVAPVRELLMQGDLRPLNVAWFACFTPDEELEPPVPAGMGSLPDSLVALASFYEISPEMLEAIAERSDAAPPTEDRNSRLRQWLKKQSAGDVRKLAFDLLTGDTAAIRAETLAQIQQQSGAPDWPVAEPARTVAEIREAAQSIRSAICEREAEEKARARLERLRQLAADPDSSLKLVRSLVKQRSTTGYEQAAQELADLREALDSEEGNRKVAAVAATLARDNPTLNRLKSALRMKGLLPDR